MLEHNNVGWDSRLDTREQLQPTCFTSARQVLLAKLVAHGTDSRATLRTLRDWHDWLGTGRIPVLREDADASRLALLVANDCVTSTTKIANRNQPMSYSDFTLKDVKQKLDLTVVEHEKLFANIAPIAISPFLRMALDRFTSLALAINTEKSRSEWIIAPILGELREQLNGQISVFSGKRFDVDSKQGLDGFCDYLISLNSEQYYISAPVLAIVEAKNESIVGGLGQCIATMLGAKLFNEHEQKPLPQVFGIVTNAVSWKFLKLVGNTAYIDLDEYLLKEVDLILGIIAHITKLGPSQPTLNLT